MEVDGGAPGDLDDILLQDVSSDLCGTRSDAEEVRPPFSPRTPFSPETPEEPLFLCDICEEMLPAGAYPRIVDGSKLGRQCENDQLSLEVRQRKLKKLWGVNYVEKYKKLRADKPAWRQAILSIRRSCPMLGRGKKRLTPEGERLVSSTRHFREHRRRRIGEMMTWPVFKAWQESAAGGGHTAQQSRDEWELQRRSNIKQDRNGTVGGKPGFLRIKIRTKDVELSDSGEASQHEHQRGTKEKRACQST